jgi:redox-sensitive bicupin YhaK (pirin superfamily)
VLAVSLVPALDRAIVVLSQRAVEVGAPGVILEVELPRGGAFSGSIASHFDGFVCVLEGDASFGASRRRATRSQIAVLGPGGARSVGDATPRSHFMLMAGKPYGEAPVDNGPFVD